MTHPLHGCHTEYSLRKGGECMGKRFRIIESRNRNNKTNKKEKNIY